MRFFEYVPKTTKTKSTTCEKTRLGTPPSQKPPVCHAAARQVDHAGQRCPRPSTLGHGLSFGPRCLAIPSGLATWVWVKMKLDMDPRFCCLVHLLGLDFVCLFFTSHLHRVLLVASTYLKSGVQQTRATHRHLLPRPVAFVFPAVASLASTAS